MIQRNVRTRSLVLVSQGHEHRIRDSPRAERYRDPALALWGPKSKNPASAGLCMLHLGRVQQKRQAAQAMLPLARSPNAINASFMVQSPGDRPDRLTSSLAGQTIPQRCTPYNRRYDGAGGHPSGKRRQQLQSAAAALACQPLLPALRRAPPLAIGHYVFLTISA